MRRRLFVQGAAAVSAGKAFPALRPSEERMLPGPREATSFNGGRSQVNLGPLLAGGDFPFLNCLKSAQSWSLRDYSALPDPDTLDDDGYPVSVSRGGVVTVLLVPSQAVRPGNYVLAWDGHGTVFLGMRHDRVSGSKTSMGGKGRFVFHSIDTRFVVGIEKVGAPHITNLRLFHADDEEALEAGEVFGARFMQRLREANFGVIRFLNWQQGNTTNVTTWATRKRASHVFYAGHDFRRDLYAGLSANRGAHYTAALAGFRLVDKATVIVKFNVDCDGPCTLDVNGTGAIPVLNEYASPLSAESNSHVRGGSWQSLATLVYDQSLQAWIKFGGDVAMGACGIESGCPPELMVRLCAELGAHPYFVTPALAADPLTDYMPELAACCRRDGPRWMVPRFEGPNELWNGAPGFYPTGLAHAKAVAYGWGRDHHNWYGKVMSVLGQAVSAEYGADRSRYQVVCGVQTALGESTAATATCDARLSSAKYLAASAAAQAPYSRTPAARWVTHVACVQYFGPGAYGSPRERQLAGAFAAEKNPGQQDVILNAYALTSENGEGPSAFTLPRMWALQANWKRWALSHGIRRMCGYEGGYSPDLGGTPEIRALRLASKGAACLERLTLANYRNFVGLSDATFGAEFPSCFQLSGRVPADNAWSVLDDLYQSPEPGQWKALVAFNRR